MLSHRQPGAEADPTGMPMRVLITGGSHTGSLAAGLSILDAAGELPPGLSIDVVPLGAALTAAGRFFDVQGDRVVITHERYRERIPVLSRALTPYDAIGFSTPFHSRGMWIQPDWYDFGLPWLEPDRAPLSKGLVARCIRNHNRHLIDFMVALQSLGFPVFALEGPRPFRHNRELVRAGAETVRYLDRQYAAHTEAALAERGIPSVMMPSHTYDAEGFCEERFRHENPRDKHHGNAELGAVMMRAVFEFLRDGRAPGPDGPAARPGERLTEVRA